ncbi:uncharacterized protein LOC120351085 [Nilaparvata lugens]|uniref:uncharacterized protein LOC120351085 n=1 Tax=Nilaparvata lugens TaxID=108931 RepID=UPI00193D1F89|nr:uncharacterized protein LOC120351085 [Nilaparvata lugens]
MAPLPAKWVTINKPFNVTGLDFAGPFVCKTSLLKRAQTTKGYLCIFVCFATKATHFEFLSSMSVNHFIATLQRFIARRGTPHTLCSDNAKTYVSAAGKMHELAKLFESLPSDVTCFLSNYGINWKFIPPYAPHHGGLWEAAVKSAKTLLYHCIGDKALTYEEFDTIFTHTESILNSQPLTELSSQPAEATSVLTPGHFLVGGPLTAPPQPIETKEILSTCHWRHCNQMTQFFWSQWSKEYPCTLMNRTKWKVTERNLQIDDLVVVKSINTSPLSWPLGRIVALHPGKDGLVRIATIKCASGNIVRDLSIIHRLI